MKHLSPLLPWAVHICTAILDMAAGPILFSDGYLNCPVSLYSRQEWGRGLEQDSLPAEQKEEGSTS